MMGKRYVILGGNQVKTKLVSQKLSHLLGLEIIDGDGYIEAGKQEEILSLIKKQDWIIQTKYNRILRLCDDKVDYVIFVDFPLWINIKDILLRLRLNHLKEILHYQKNKTSMGSRSLRRIRDREKDCCTQESSSSSRVFEVMRIT